MDAAPPARLALIELARDGQRNEITFAQVADRSARLAGTLAQRGIGKGDVVMTMIGNRPEWVYAMVASFRIGAVVLPSTEQLRPGDLRARFDKVEPHAVIADRRNLETIAESGFDGDVLAVPDEGLFAAHPAPAADLSPTDPALITFTSGTAGEPKPIRHGQRYLYGQHVQAEHWSVRARATCAGARPPAGGRSPPATRSSRAGSAEPRRSCTTAASIPRSASPLSSAKA